MKLHAPKRLRTGGYIFVAALFVHLSSLASFANDNKLPSPLLKGVETLRSEPLNLGTVKVGEESSSPAELPLMSLEGAADYSLGEAPKVQSPGCGYSGAMGSAVTALTTDPASFYKAGLAALSEGLGTEALYYFQQVLKLGPDHPDAGPSAFWLGELKRREEKYGQAIYYFGRVTGAYADEARYRYAWSAQRAGRLEQAEEMWIELSDDSSSAYRTNALTWIGKRRYLAGDFEGGVAPLEKAVELEGDAGDGDALFLLALLNRDAGRVDEAQRQLTAFLLSHPESALAPQGRVAQGQLLLERGDYSGAVKRLGWAIEEGLPEDLEMRARYGRVRALAESGETSAAKEESLALEDFAPQKGWPGWGFFEVGWLMFSTDEYIDALDYLARARENLAGASRLNIVNFLMGEALYRLVDFSGAAKYFGEVEDGELKVYAMHREGDALLLGGEGERGEVVLQNLLAEYPGYDMAGEVWLRLGNVRLAKGENRRAAHAFESVDGESPVYPEAILALARIAGEEGGWERSVELFGKYLARYGREPGNDGVTLELAKAMLSAGQVDRAKEVLENLTVNSSQKIRFKANLFLGELLLERGDIAGREPLITALTIADDLEGERIDSDLVEAYLLLGGSFTSSGDYESGLTHYRSALKAGEKEAIEGGAKMAIAEILTKLGRADEALKFYDSMDKSSEGLRGRVEALIGLGRLKEASATLEEYLATGARGTGVAALEERLADLYAKSGSPMEAASYYKRASSRISGEGADRAKILASQNLRRGGDLEGAIATLTEITSMESPFYLEAEEQIGEIYLQMDKPLEAAAHFTKLGREEEDKRLALSSFRRGAKALLLAGDWSSAIALSQEALLKAPLDDPSPRQRLLVDIGEYHIAGEDYEGAIPPLLEGSELLYGDTGLKSGYLLGLAYEKSQKFEDAIATYLRLGLLYPRTAPLVMEGKLSAALILERLGRLNDAVDLYGELLKDGTPELKVRVEERLKLLENR
ncbi:MAG: hypothetical protein C0608_03405 [Deltaproteobacteria bacterium]|nr:MAG: hypothetical protein C0608_03405 [Deltaproteobacteria bacterium]